jgi:hypothetical protein
MSASTLPTTALDRACAEIFARWIRVVPPDEARAQADAFRARFATIAAEQRLTEAELDATLAVVADAMASS